MEVKILSKQYWPNGLYNMLSYKDMHLHLIAPLSLDLRLLNVCVQFTLLHKGLAIDLLVELTIDKVNVSTFRSLGL
jgi:hypothetical protein